MRVAFDVRSVTVRDTMSTIVKVASETDEVSDIGQLTDCGMPEWCGFRMVKYLPRR